MEDEKDCKIEKTFGGYKLSMPVASSFYGGIIDLKGATKRRIESETQCSLIIPQKDAIDNSDIVIESKSRNNVLLARREIQLLLTSLRKQKRPTHFYGIALNYGDVKKKFNDFKSQVMTADIPGIEETLFQTENGIHLTFGICVLMDDVEIAKGTEILQSCREFLYDLKPPFKVHVSGLEIMNDDPSSVKVLYASVKSPELQVFADRCFKRFNDSKLGFDDFNRGYAKLHMTIMNNRFRESRAKSFDASEIFKRWGNFDFGTVQCNELLLCVIGSSKDSNDFYKIISSIKLM